ncbi:MAG TPA: hypothetical protein VD866_03245 [Urbifossiella sp.]|nr:hypothetical protein [Urbifossiella sp.]
MGTVTLDDALRAKLNGLNEHLEIRTPDGKLVGHYLPDEAYRRLQSELVKAEFDRQDAEDAARGVVRKWDGTNGRTTAEAIAYLEQLGEKGAAGL